MRLSAAVVDTATLSKKARKRLATELFQTHKQIFSGLSLREFSDYVLRDRAAKTRIAVYREANGTPIGYFAAHRYSRTILGRQATIFRVEAGLLPAYRGRASTWHFGLLSALKYKLRHPFRPVYYLGMLVHPSSYCLLAERFPVTYPSRRRKTPREIAESMRDLAASFEFPPVRDDPMVRNVGWVTRETPEQRGIWTDSKHPDVRFYLSLNPEYTKGFGLVTLVPLNFTNLFGGLLRHLWLGVNAGLTRGWNAAPTQQS